MVVGIANAMHRAFRLSPMIQSPRNNHWTSVEQVQRRAALLETLTDTELTATALELRDAARGAGFANGTAGHEPRGLFHRAASRSDTCLLIDGCALVREAVRRTTGKLYFPVQMLAGLCLSEGCVAEMQTGEGKTLTSAIPAFVHALRFPGVHIATPNVYLANRDYEELRCVYELLGLRVGLLPDVFDAADSRAAYQCDITYGAGYAFGFDFLRDELSRRQRPGLSLGQETVLSLRGGRREELALLQPGHWCGLVDEIDSVLLDEAMTPLILSAGAQQPARDAGLLRLARLLADNLERGKDFQILTAVGKPQLTPAGLEKSEQALSAPEMPGLPREVSLRSELKRPWSAYVENALQARFVLKPDVDYVVRDGQVQIVDQKTGRIFSDRSWRGGLHQAVQERAGVGLSEEKTSLGRITRQSYYKRYASLCGMTGTAAGAEAEFSNIYRLNTVRIPTHRPSLRITHPDRFFRDFHARLQAIVTETAERHSRQQPVLIGTRTIASSEQISASLTARGIPHIVLNGKQDQEEADIIAEAGHRGHVTVATNMAGRGTDIKPDREAVAAGGLHVIGVERNESRRVDRQLEGRAARSGAPGSSQFYLSADDELIDTHASHLAALWRRSADASGECRRDDQEAVARLQAAREQAAFEWRRLMMQQDREMNVLLDALCYRMDGEP